MDESNQHASSGPDHSRVATVVAVLLGLLVVGASIRAVLISSGTRDPSTIDLSETSLYDEDTTEAARALVQRLVGGILKLQTADGGFRPEAKVSSTFGHELDRVAGSAGALAALAASKGLCDDAKRKEIDDALALGFAFLQGHQQDHGAIGRYVDNRRWSQVEATVSSVLAWSLADREQDRSALKSAARALVPMARQGIRNGWTRGLNAMAVEWLLRREQQDVFDAPSRELVEARKVAKMPRDAGTSYRDQNMAEAISRTVLGLEQGGGAFPKQMVGLLTEEKPSWNGQATDVQTWWMEAWLVARLGRDQAQEWFVSLAGTLSEWTDDSDLIPGGWYAAPLIQTSAAVLALREGFGRHVGK